MFTAVQLARFERMVHDLFAAEPPHLDPFGGDLSITLIGAFEHGGTIEFFIGDERVDEPLPVPRSEWAAFALLVQGALKRTPLGRFFTSEQLAEALRRQRVIATAEPQNASNILYRLRKRLSRLKVAAKLVAAGRLTTVEEFADKLIPTQRVLGYSISLSPDRLAFQFRDEH